MTDAVLVVEAIGVGFVRGRLLEDDDEDLREPPPTGTLRRVPPRVQ